jgi:hypothetical protein
MQDHELDKLLNLASTPKPTKGFEQRLLEKIEAQSNIIVFPKRKTASPWLIGLPLAASLAVGIWLGATNTLPTASTLMVSQSTDISTNSGFDDVVALIEDNLS